ncbi:FecR family protein [Pedobacter nyackensis]|uniref:FecR family protein n=2 Tax=Pedobacter nyackensis TaxID=475255 RepID=A0A1W2EKP9_9SPHI|nr:FecR family protein [Pedobacter nyackensis]
MYMGKIHLDKTEILNLASRISEGAATDEEIRRYNVIYRQFQQSEATPMDTEGVNLLREQMIENINQQLIPPARANIRLWITRIAASIILIGSVAAGFYFLNSSQKDLAKQAVVVPGGNKAILTLADGKRIILDTAHGLISKEANIAVSNAANGIISYEKLKSALNGTQLEFNKIETPRGGTYRVNLSDGTRVWLNSASTLRYPVAYSKEQRVVELEGEAYFEVAKDRSHPFKVKSKGQIVEVLGTHFNVNGYDDEPFTKTTLLEGSIMVSTVKNKMVLKPMQESLNSNGVLSGQQTVDADEAVAWKNGYFQFNDENLESVMRQISRWYDVEVVFVGKPSNKKFNGMISRSKGIKIALEIMEATGNVRFKMEGRKLIVKT